METALREDGVDYNSETAIICGEEGCEESAISLEETPRIVEKIKLESIQGHQTGFSVLGRQTFLRRCRTHFEGRPEVQIYRRYWGETVPRPKSIEVNSRG